ncbi:MAG: HD domain-containing protein [Deltaproteobacteria bacterium]|nr:HD domain-containing protein [Deltaproteobacteria bacterium]
MGRSFGPRFESALMYACMLHYGQIRKGNGCPYITHPLAVAALVAEYGGDENQVIAALLHDVLEDCDVTTDALVERYGQDVADMVVACSDTTSRPKPPWRPRKEAYLKRLATIDGRAKLVITADKLHNIQSILHDLERPSVGELIWDRFRAPKLDQLWYFNAVTAALGDGWQSELLDELRRAVARIPPG